ncbi:hypothetical protein [Flavobacterium sp. AG291]|uniref:hypothetical protein n=1 Tax=Flavobacterium sp. AG291 TaxID=2184000 RepID=UPI000E0BB82B|nr:hypothetical protein [Flavobacterium sp. AG291]RDI04412.1 hypothetical protein DEU42_1249 [Flavobacterium sp. AG291]
MEDENLKALGAFTEKLTTATEFNTLRPSSKREGIHKVGLYFTGYNDLTLTVVDIISVCTAALYGMEDNEGNTKYASAFTIAEVLSLALDLSQQRNHKSLTSAMDYI